MRSCSSGRSEDQVDDTYLHPVTCAYATMWTNGSRRCEDGEDPKGHIAHIESSRTLGKLAMESNTPKGTLQHGHSKMSLVERVRSEVSGQEQEENEDLPIEFGKWTGTISCTSFDGIPTITATENKMIDL